ncbi:hypothetical protein [Thiolapillus brandeum]|uniref:Uncharacterized protein n=1 Tax=Thiolapillus brandeum TaxID=1076588 RepID=A0A7U6GK29_9GAMM|nr:hypothetical protein [Thiolapillus brandeum]BAO45034.1 hypothetical protein TBH_C2122 [Thiolapillus brandeum]
MLKKSIHGLFQLEKTKMRFCLSSIFNDLWSLKMAAHPCAAIRLPKNGVFQQPVKWTQRRWTEKWHIDSLVPDSEWELWKWGKGLSGIKPNGRAAVAQRASAKACFGRDDQMISWKERSIETGWPGVC